MKKTLLITASLLTIAACSEIPPGAYYNRGDPENLLDASSEVINLTLSSPKAMSDLSSMVAQDPPTRAELSCSPTDLRCTQAKQIFSQHGIPVQYTEGSGGVALVYERVIARDCQNRYIDNTINPYNLEPPTFGCSVTANTVQQVSDKRQFTNPNLMDFRDGEKTVQEYREYLKPDETPAQKSVNTSLISTVAGDSGGTSR